LVRTSEQSTVLTGMLSHVPGVMSAYRRMAFRPNPAAPEQSYRIWLKHYSVARVHGMPAVPKTVVELGPGLSLGAGLAALLCGAQRYTAIDVVRFVRMETVLPVFDSVVDLLRRRWKLNARGFPFFEGALDDSGWPVGLDDGYIARMLDEQRIEGLRNDVLAFVKHGASDRIAYVTRAGVSAVPVGAADFVFSHTVLQHVESVPGMWNQVAAMLRPGAFTTHQIHFYNHGTSPTWNGHWAYPEWLWRVALGRKDFLINREPLSSHLDAARRAGLTVLDCSTREEHGGIPRADLAPRWRHLTDEDLATRHAFVTASAR
jgi:hypothetical protein